MLDKFQEVGMKNVVKHPRVVDASREPQPPFGPNKEMQFVDLEPYDESNVVDATDGGSHGEGEGGGGEKLPPIEHEEDEKMKSFWLIHRHSSVVFSV